MNEFDYSFGSNPLMHTYMYGSPGLQTGNPYIDMLVNILFQGQLAARPSQTGNQSILQAFQLQQRSKDFFGVGMHSMTQHPLFQRFGGVNQDSTLLKALSPFFVAPDSLGARMMTPFMGGNPAQASMSMYANMTGQTMGAFGRIGNISAEETNQLMDMLYNRTYIQRVVTKEEAERKKGNMLQNAYNLSSARNILGPDGKPLTLENISNYSTESGIKQFQSDFSTPNKLANLVEDYGKKIKAVDPADATQVEQLKNRLKEAGEELIKSMTDGTAKNKLKGLFEEAVKEGSKDAINKLRGEYNPDSGKLLNILRESVSAGKPGVKGAGVDYSVTRGQQLQDITGAFQTAADLRLLSKGGVVNNFDDFLKTGGSILSAGKSLFGNELSGKEILESYSELIDSDFVDLKTEEGKQTMLNMAYGTKGAAYLSGIDEKTVLAVNKQYQNIVRNTPGLERIGGVGLTEDINNMFTQNTALGAFLGNDYIRSRKGMVGMMNDTMKGRLDAMQSENFRRLAALRSNFEQSGNTEAVALIDKFAESNTTKDIIGSDKEMGHNFQAIDTLLNSQAMRKVTGYSASELMQISTNQLDQEIGVRSALRNNKLSNVAFKANADAFSAVLLGNVASGIGNAGAAVLNIAFTDKKLDTSKEGRKNLIDILESDEVGMFVNKDVNVDNVEVPEAIKAQGTEDVYKEFLRRSANPEAPVTRSNAAKFANLVGTVRKKGPLQDAEQIIQAIGAKDPTTTGMASRMMGYTPQFLERYNKNYKALSSTLEEARQTYIKDSEMLSAEMGHLSAPATQNILNTFISGDMDSKGFREAIRANFGTLKNQPLVEERLQNAYNLGREFVYGDPDRKKYYQTLASAAGTKDVELGKNLEELVNAGMSYKDIKAIGSGEITIEKAIEQEKARGVSKDERRIGILERLQKDSEGVQKTQKAYDYMKAYEDKQKAINQEQGIKLPDNYQIFKEGKSLKDNVIATEFSTGIEIRNKSAIERVQENSSNVFTRIISNMQNSKNENYSPELASAAKQLQDLLSSKDFGVLTGDGFDFKKHAELLKPIEKDDGTFEPSEYSKKLEELRNVGAKSNPSLGAVMAGFDSVITQDSEKVASMKRQMTEVRDAASKGNSFDSVTAKLDEMKNLFQTGFTGVEAAIRALTSSVNDLK